MTFLTNKQAPTYLHFLDRELRRAENAEYNDEGILEAIIIAVINSLSYCYSSASLLLESNQKFPISISLLLELEKNGFVKLLTNEHSYEEFIESRRVIYAHKANRYPMYFEDNNSKLWPLTPIHIESSTTTKLRNSISTWIDNPSTTISLSKENFTKLDLNTFNTKLYEEREKAITLDLFLSKEQLANDSLRRNSGRLVSYFYTKRYIDLFHGDILCNLPQLSFYDALSSNKDLNNSILINAILKCCYIPDFFFCNKKFNSIYFLQFLCNKLFRNFQIELFSIIQGLLALSQDSQSIDLYKTIKYFESNFYVGILNPGISAETFLNIAYSNIYSAAARISQYEKAFLKTYSMTKENLTTNKRVLIVTATALEAKTVLQTMESKGKTPNAISINKVTLWNFGVLGNSELHLLKLSEMGSSKPSGSALVIYDAIKVLNPNYVIMVGIAFGLKRKKQKIGDILVSRELQDYDSTKKTATGTIQRGHKIPAGVTLLDRFDNSSLRYKGANIEVGFIVSGDTLSDSKPFVDELVNSFPEAIGGEMEGTGLQSSCHRDSKEWILIKGICDWGYDKQHDDKERDQQIAINNVCDYLIYTLTNFEF